MKLVASSMHIAQEYTTYYRCVKKLVTSSKNSTKKLVASSLYKNSARKLVVSNMYKNSTNRLVASSMYNSTMELVSSSKNIAIQVASSVRILQYNSLRQVCTRIVQ